MIKKIIKYFFTYIIIILISLLALIVVSFISKDAIKNNIKESSEYLVEQGEEKEIHSLGRNLYNNNSTDAIMLNIIYCIDNTNIVESILTAKRNYIPGITQNVIKDILGDLPHESEDYVMTEELLNTVNEKEQTSYEYARYWHGYITILRPLLVLFNIKEIRLIFEIILILLLGYLTYYIYKNSNIILAIMVAINFISFNFFSWGATIQGIFIMILAITISIFVANKKINYSNFNILLFITGALTSYFDFLTTPLITFLLPVVIFNIVNRKETTLKKEISDFLKRIFCWLVGYIGLWATKWILIDIAYDTGMIKLSILQFLYRTGMIKEDVPNNLVYLSLFYNFMYSLNCISVGLVFAGFFNILGNIKNYKIKYYFNASKVVYYISFIIPIVWYIIIAEHSWQHSFFTYKTLLISLLSLILIIFDNREKIEKQGNKENG